MKNINWKVRLQSGSWWMGVISAIVIAVFAILKICNVEMSVTQEEILNIATLVLMIPAAIGIISDPTTKGIADSAQALDYETPKDDRQLGAGGMTIGEFINKYLGKKTDWDGAYGVQCVDLIDAYIDDVLQLEKGFWGNAKNWWTDRNKSKWLKDNFKFITPKYKNGELKPGDIGIRTSGAYGHIFIVADKVKNGKLHYYDQNATGNNEAMSYREKSYTASSINGILRPKKQSAIGAVAVNYNKGDKYILTNYINVWTEPTTSSQIKKVKDLTADGKKHASSKRATDNAVLRTGTVVSCQGVTTDTSGNVWLKIPSGYIPVYYKGLKRANWYNK